MNNMKYKLRSISFKKKFKKIMTSLELLLLKNIFDILIEI
jgi:hypothetical protein